MMLRHLLWKDGMTVKPLISAVLCSFLGMFLALALISTWMHRPDFSSLVASFWVLIPNLIALGAPAILVGGEEDSGTLGWLRTLPVRWQTIADAKFLIGLSAVIIAWIVSSAFFIAARATYVPLLSPYAASMLSGPGIMYLLFFSVLLLTCGFITAYLFRSPVAGLIALVPLITIVNVTALNVGRWLLTGHTHPVMVIETISFSSAVMLGMSGIALLLVAWIVQRLVARRRLSAPQGKPVQNMIQPDVASAYHPPALVGTSRPNPIAALLWQQSRQSAFWCGLISLIVAGFLLIAYMSDVGLGGQLLSETASLTFLVAAIGATWIGGLSFYGDNVRKRAAFFADRGIAPTRIWWTRLLVPALFCAALVVLSLVDPPELSRPTARSHGQLAVALVAMFMVGQLVGQWMKRPVLTFFAAPAMGAVVGAVLITLFAFYPSMHWTALLSVPVMLFATWRLTSRWMSGRTDQAYGWRAVGYTVLALVLPIVGVISQRIATTPDVMPQWRAGVLASQTPSLRTYDNGNPVYYSGILTDAFYQSGFSIDFNRATFEDKKSLLNKELSSDEIGRHVALDDLRHVTNTDTNLELKWLAGSVLVKWAKQIRENVAAGKNGFWGLENGAESSEALAIDLLEDLSRRYGPSAELSELVSSLPDSELRQNSRRIGLLTEWKAFDRLPWSIEANNQIYYGKAFMHHSVATRVSMLGYEQRRSSRYIDKLTRLLLDQLDHGLPVDNSDPAFIERDRLWQEGMDSPTLMRPNAMPTCRNWTQAYEDRITRLRSRFE